MEEKCLSEWGRDHLEFEGCFLTRRRGDAEKHAENTFRGLASVLGNVEQESQDLRARRQRRSYSFASRLTPGWKAEKRRIPRSGWVHWGECGGHGEEESGAGCSGQGELI